jgi:hypothetical protein
MILHHFLLVNLMEVETMLFWTIVATLVAVFVVDTIKTYITDLF